MIRKRAYLSPSAVSLWHSNRQEFFLKYLAVERPPRMPQTEAMSVGSAFDAWVKSVIATQFGIKDAAFDFDTLFEKQVEEQNRDFAAKAGKDCFDQYDACGALNSLIKRLKDSCGIRMEFSAQGTVDATSGGVYAPVGTSTTNPVVVLGIPDLAYITNGGVPVIHDFKVNGYCSQSRTSPVAGYINSLGEGKGGAHPSAHLFHYKDMEINAVPNIERSKPEWATQLCCYGWLTGIPVGSDMIVSVDQLCFSGGRLRVCQHRCKITADYQLGVIESFQKVWDAIESGLIFDEDNDALIEKLSRQALAYSDDDKGEWLASVTRRHKF